MDGSTPARFRNRHRRSTFKTVGRDDLVEIRFMVEEDMRGEIVKERRWFTGKYVPTQAEICRVLIREALDRRVEIRKAKGKRFIDQALEAGVPLKVVE